MLTLNDELEKDVLTAILCVPERRLQRKEIRNQLSPKYEGIKKKYAKGSFDPVLQKKLDRLRSLGLLRREYVARSAFYSITGEAKDKVELLVERQEIKKKIDQMTPEEIQKLKETLDAAFNVLIQRKIDDVLNEGRQYITVAEINQVFEDVRRERTRPKVGNLFEFKQPYKSREERLHKTKQRKTEEERDL